MKIVSFNQIIELNKLLRIKDLQFKIHIKDACGGQSFYIEQLGQSDGDNRKEEMHQMIEQFFADNKMTIVYAEDKIHFTME
ncbi:MAG: hypothetical protein ACERKZ_02115 [Lachnotalea sp.]